MNSLENNNQYRMAKKHYHCYGCNEDLVKMIAINALEQDGLSCDNCGSGFCVIMEDQPLEPLQKQIEEEKQNEVIGSSLIQTL